MSTNLAFEDNKQLKNTRIRDYTLTDIILDRKKQEEVDRCYLDNYEYIEEDDMSKKMRPKQKRGR